MSFQLSDFIINEIVHLLKNDYKLSQITEFLECYLVTFDEYN
ncbi:hypothetical protein ACJ72_08809 [Emergomyces africanus]|uniref:Uncharacterized protein n=1 Tax=Emergomyces africanus TaxID=1955775 RepID=A0A1B7NJD3_9EURO|nr:hypothetical protein ACJ72_08809 [Emergomyces africanus]